MLKRIDTTGRTRPAARGPRSRGRSSGTIHVPQRHRFLPRQPVKAQPLARLRHHVGGAPGHAGEQRGQRLAHADQDVAAVLGRIDHRVGAAAQHVGRLAQMRGHHGRTVGADHEGRPARGLERRQHAGAEVAVGLARERNVAMGAQRLERRVGFVRRGPHRHRPGRRGTGGFDRAFGQPRLQPRGTRGAQCRDQPRLGEARDRRFRQHRDRDRLSRRHSRYRLASFAGSAPKK